MRGPRSSTPTEHSCAAPSRPAAASSSARKATGAVFANAREAVAAAADGQRALAVHAWPAGAPLLVRMGLHTGEPVLTAEGDEGLDMHRGARVMAAGHGGQVLLTGAVRET